MQKKTIHLGKTARGGDVEIDVELRDTPQGLTLSIVGNVWLPGRRDIESGGQLQENIRDAIAPGRRFVSREKLDRIIAIWQRWHLNDMRAGCEHQRDIDTTEQVEVVYYGLTMEAYQLRNKTRAALTDAALRGELLQVNKTAHALASLDLWYRDVTTPPDADSPLSGCFEVKKRETKAIGWVRPDEHPRGMLGKACAVCGYRYGYAWLHEPLPADVIAEVEAW